MTSLAELPDVLPYADEHVHLLSAAAARRSVDVSALAAPTVPDALAVLARAAARLPPGAWVRAWGFDDALVPEQRLPTRDELDAAAPRNPLVLHHRAGHVELRNSLGDADPGGPPRLDLRGDLASLSAEMAGAGIGALTDTTPTNGPDEVAFLRSLPWQQHLTVMVGASRLGQCRARGLRHGLDVGGVRIGHAKVSAAPESIGALVWAAHEAGWPAAVHVVELDELEATLEAFEGSTPPEGTYDRIEHLALSLPEHVERIASLSPRPVVVTQPSFLAHRGGKYRAQLSEVEQGWLYRVRSLLDAGIEVRFSSDAPVVPARPGEWVTAAVDRFGFAPDEAVDAATAEACCSRPLPPP